MKDSKLVKILKTFSEQEFSEFEKFTDSPFFCNSKILPEFLKFIKQFYPDFNDEKFNAELIFNELYPGKIFESKTSENLIHKLSSELFKLCKEFLIHSKLKNDDNRRKYYLLESFRTKKLNSEFEKEYKITGSDGNDIYKGGTDNFINNYFRTKSFLEYSIDKGKAVDAFESILTTGEYIVIAALTKGFRNGDTNLAALNYNIDTRYNLIDNFISHLDSEKLLASMKKNNDRFYPYAEVSYGIHKIFKYPDDDRHYFNLKNLVFNHYDLFGHTERYILYHTLISFCSRRLYAEDSELFKSEEFDLFEKILELGIYKYSQNDSIQINSFRSIILSAVDNNKLEWAENFVKNYLKELHPEYQENMRYYSMAIIHFEKNEYEKALENIVKVKYDFILFKSDVKNYMFKIYYELGFFDQAYSMLDTMRHYNTRTKDISDSFKQRETNFIKYAAELLKIRSRDQKTSLEYLKDKAEAEKFLGSRNWIIEKCTKH